MKLGRTVSQYVDEFNAFITNYLGNIDSLSTQVESSVLQTKPKLQYRGLSPILSENATFQSKDMAEFVKALTDKFTSELDCLLYGTKGLMPVGDKDDNSWASVVLSDLEYSIRMACLECTSNISIPPNQITYSSVKLGSVYAWAREINLLKTEIPCDVQKCREKLCRRLTRLVWLSKCCKQRANSHFLLTNLHHELVKIRTRFTGRFSIDKKAANISAKPGRLHPIRFHDQPFSFSKPVVPPKLANAFSQLTSEITDLLLKLSPQIQGLSVINLVEDPQKRQSFLHKQVELAILDFYTFLDESTDSTTNNHEMKTAAFLDNGDTSSIDSSSDECIRSLTMNAATVQGLLDKFDHHNLNRYKRTTSCRTRDTTSCGWFSSLPTTASIGAPTPDQTTDNKTHQTSDSTLNSAEIISESALDDDITHHNNNVDLDAPTAAAAVCENSSSVLMSTIAVGDLSDAQFSSDRATKRPHSQISRKYRPHAHRSIRTHHNRTFSDASFSEGEVLSDTEEEEMEEEGVRDDDDLHFLAKRSMTNLSINQQSEPTDIDDVEPHFINSTIRIVNNQLRAVTPFGDQPQFDNIAQTFVAPESQIADQGINGSQPSLNGETISNHITGDNEVQRLLDECIEFCQTNMQRLIVQTQADLHHMGDILPSTYCVDANVGELNADELKVDEFELPDLLKADINSTTSTFKEHVTSILAHLFHAVTTSFEKHEARKHETLTSPVNAVKLTTFANVIFSEDDDGEPPVINTPCRRSTRCFTDKPSSGIY